MMMTQISLYSIKKEIYKTLLKKFMKKQKGLTRIRLKLNHNNLKNQKNKENSKLSKKKKEDFKCFSIKNMIKTKQ